MGRLPEAGNGELVRRLREKARTLYLGEVVPHHSCGIAVATTFSLPTRPYQALRKGGITGEGLCGAVMAGQLVLGELLGDPDPTGAVTAVLREAIAWFQDAWLARVRGGNPDIVCDHLVRPLGEFTGQARKHFCTNIAADVAALTAEALCRFAPDKRPAISAMEGV